MPTRSKEIGLIGGIEKRKLEIVDYDPRWPAIFQTHASIITKALDANAIRVEHIGSTAVPGLAAKPIIDILMVVPDAADEDTYLPQMEAAGYQLRVREPDFHEHRMFRTPQKDVHIHVYSQESPEIIRNLAFRDRLRNVPDERRLYEETKRRLVAQDWADMNAYAQAKTDVIERILVAAFNTFKNSR